MAAPIVVPFNNNPSSTTFKTASYTVPSGKYAYFTPLQTSLSDSLGSNPANQSRTSPLITLNGNQIPHHITVNCTFSTTSNQGFRTITYPLNNVLVSSDQFLSNNAAFYTLTSTINFAGNYQTMTLSGTAGTTATQYFSTNSGFCQSIVFSASGTTVNATTTFTYSAMILASNIRSYWIPSGSVITVAAGSAYYSIEEYNNIS